MKSLLKTYVDPLVEDRIKILATKSDTSVSALVAELLNVALNKTENSSVENSKGMIEQQLYLQHFTLTILLDLHQNLSDLEYEKLKEMSKEWAINQINRPEGA